MIATAVVRRTRGLVGCAALGWVLVGTAAAGAQSRIEPVGTIPGPANLVKTDGTHAYVVHHRTFTVFDVSDPREPRKTGTFSFPEEIWKFRVQGDRAYVGVNFHGLSILDISDPTSPRELGNFKSLGQTKIGAVYDTKVAYIDHMEGFVLIDVSDETAPQSIGSFFLDGYAREVVTAGQYAFATDSPTGVYIFDLEREGPPEPIAVLHAPAAPRHALHVSTLPNGSTLLTGVRESGLQVYDVTDPTAPVKTADFDTPGESFGVAVQDHLAYVADGEAGLQLVDLTDPSDPRIVETVPTQRPARDVAVADSLILVVTGQSEREGDDRDITIYSSSP